jgi:hypothetical protein
MTPPPFRKSSQTAQLFRALSTPDFMFRLTATEFGVLTSQIAISKPGQGGRRQLPWAFSEHGAIQAANVLNSPRAISMGIYVVRAFARVLAP